MYYIICSKNNWSKILLREKEGRQETRKGGRKGVGDRERKEGQSGLQKSRSVPAGGQGEGGAEYQSALDLAKPMEVRKETLNYQVEPDTRSSLALLWAGCLSTGMWQPA